MVKPYQGIYARVLAHFILMFTAGAVVWLVIKAVHLLLHLLR
jgi:hypothetical protein